MINESKSNAISTRDERIIELYRAVTYNKIRTPGDEVLVGQPALAELGKFDDERLRVDLHECFSRLASMQAIQTKQTKQTKGPTLNQWLEHVRAREVATQVGVNLDLSSHVRYIAWQLVYMRSEVARSKPKTFDFSPEILTEACGRLLLRVGEAAMAEMVLQERRPVWRKPPVGSFAGAPIIECDDAEIAVVAILASGTDEWQFSSRKDGHIFRGIKSGYHLDHERTFVSGLSDVIDTVSDVVARHRNGDGGRVFISKNHVECAECKMVVAWINNVGSRLTALDRCSKK